MCLTHHRCEVAEWVDIVSPKLCELKLPPVQRNGESSGVCLETESGTAAEPGSTLE